MKTAKRIFLSPPHMGGEEIHFVQQAFESNYIAPLGPMVDAFEYELSEYTRIKHCLALSSGTAAMHLALRCLGVGPGDEVFASTLTFIGSVTPILFQGATPVFIDSERTTWNMDPELLEEELFACERRGKLPKAVIPTDLYGQCADYNRIIEVCRRYGVPVVADAAEALGARYLTLSSEGTEEKAEGRRQRAENSCASHSSQLVHAGKDAKAAVFSFNGNKIITTSGGGMLASDDKELIEHARFLSQQARDSAPHYEHSTLGYNYRMSNIVAAIGRGQLQVLDERIEQKRRIFDYYRRSLGNMPGVEFMPEAYGRCTRWLTVILITPEEFGADREQLRLALEAENIESRPVWKPMHLQPVFTCHQTTGGMRPRAEYSGQQYQARVVGGRVAEDLFRCGLCLPSGTAMTDQDLDRVIPTIKRTAQRKSEGRTKTTDT